MIETIGLVLHYINDALRIANPFLFFGATCIWISLKMRMEKELGRMYLRCFALEKQIDYLVNHEKVDADFIRYMQGIHNECR